MQKKSTYYFRPVQKFLLYPPERKRLIWKLMKLSLVQITLGMILSGVVAAHDNYAQEVLNREVSLNLKEVTLKKALSELETATKVKFVYSRSHLKLNEKVSLDAGGRKLGEILEEIFTPRDIQYSVQEGNDYIVLTQHKQSGDAAPAEESPANIGSGFAAITGTIRDASTQQPLPGVNVIIKGTTNGTTTDAHGEYSLSFSQENAILVFSFIGYVTQEVVVAGRTVIDILLTEDVQKLEEVVIVGYGEQKKINLTGAVEVVKGESLVNRATTTVSQALQGKVSGVNFSAGSFGFEPGAALDVQIRGQGSPLVLIDRVPGTLNGLNPNDIESISVLKDAAAAAIYGAQAPYGVILITTKSGKMNNRLNIELSSSVSSIRPIRMPHHVDSYTAALALNEAAVNSGIPPIFTNTSIDRILQYQADPENTPETVPSSANAALWGNLNESNANYDWFDVYYGEGFRNQENLAVSGGSNAASYYVSLGHIYDEGVLQVATDDYRRYNTIAKFDANLTEWFRFSSNTRYYNTTRTRPAYDNQGDYNLLFHHVARTFPSQYMISPNGVYSIQSKIPWTRDAGNETWNTNDFVNRFEAEIAPLKGWTINADYSFQLTHTEFTSNNFTVYEDKVDGSPVLSGSTSPSHVKKYQQVYFYNTMNLYSTYKFDINDAHYISLMGGYQQEQSRTSYLWARKNDMVSQEVPSINTSTGTVDGADNLSQYATQGFFTRLNYNFKERYLLEINSRYDGTYKFAKDKRWGFFPSVSVGWNVSNERFWETLISRINMLKIRSSWGGLGNQLTAAAYQDLPLMGVGSNLAWIINGRRPGYTTAPNLVNTEITWETSATKDLGIDLEFLNNRLAITGDLYQRKTYDQLGPANSLPAVIGVTTLPRSNNMETVTNGWELSMTWKNKNGGDFNYSVAAMMFDYSTRVTRYNNPTRILTNPYAGQVTGEIWGFVTDGLIQTQAEADDINSKGLQKAVSGQVWKTGDVRYTDLTGEGTITYGANTVDDPGDRKIIGNATPRHQFGLTLAANWKGFDISMFWQGVAKREVMLSGNMFWGFSGWNQSSIFPGHLDYYRDTEGDTYKGFGINTDGYFPRPYVNPNMNQKNQVIQTRYLQNAAFARLKTVHLGYSLSKGLLDKIKMQGLYLYVSGENLWTLTRMVDHFDPETAHIGGWGNAKSYFSQAAFTAGLNLKF